MRNNVPLDVHQISARRDRIALLAEVGATVMLALPLVAGQLAVIGQHVVDIVLAGHLGPDVLGAVSVGANAWSLPLMAIVGLMMAVPPSVAQLDGAGRRNEIGALFRQAVWTALGLGLVMGLMTYFGSPLLVRAMGMDPVLAENAAGFLRPIAFQAPSVALFCACRGVTDGLSMPRIGMIFSMLGLVLLPPAAWAMMYGRLGFPPMGAAGSAIATAGVSWILALAYLAFVRFGAATSGVDWRRGRRAPDPSAILGFLRLGVPMSVSVLLEVGLFSFVALIVGGFGTIAVGSHQIALSVASTTFMVPLGLSMAITVRVGNAVGRKDPAGVRLAGLAGIGLAGLTQALACVLLLALPAVIAGWYTNDPALQAGAAGLLFLAALFQMSDGVQVASAGALRGLKDTRVPMLITAIAYWGIGMPTGWLLAFPAGMGVSGMWFGLIAGLSFAAMLLLGRFVRLSRRAA
jgi:MATE family multidrug resistance protein